MKSAIITSLLICSVLHFSYGQQAKKYAGHAMQRRQEKLAFSSAGDVSLKTYTHLKKESLIMKPKQNLPAYRKLNPSMQGRKKLYRTYAR